MSKPIFQHIWWDTRTKARVFIEGYSKPKPGHVSLRLSNQVYGLTTDVDTALGKLMFHIQEDFKGVPQ
jgi:hypothetical protein